MKPLANKAALVTGSTGGIGLGIARALAAAGASVMLNGFGDPAAIAALCGELRGASGARAAHDGADLANPGEIAAMFARVAREWGGVDILVNNAGIQHAAPIEDFPPERWDALIALNLTAAFHTTRLAIPGMRLRGWGRVVNIASAHGKVASPNKCAYVAAKHGLLGLTKVAALELAGSGITANALCPGWVRTPLVEAQLRARAERSGAGVEAEAGALLAEKQPLAEFSTPEQIGGLVGYLCSDLARTVTGAAWSIDGGWTAV